MPPPGAPEEAAGQGTGPTTHQSASRPAGGTWHLLRSCTCSRTGASRLCKVAESCVLLTYSHVTHPGHGAGACATTRHRKESAPLLEHERVHEWREEASPQQAERRQDRQRHNIGGRHRVKHVLLHVWGVAVEFQTRLLSSYDAHATRQQCDAHTFFARSGST